MQKRHKHHTHKNVKTTGGLSAAKGNGHRKYEKGISLKGLKYRKKYKVEKGFYKVEHKNERDKKDDFKAEMVKDCGNYILMRKLKSGFMYCITKGTLICGGKKLVKLV
jgi:hypothetical protein